MNPKHRWGTFVVLQKLVPHVKNKLDANNTMAADLVSNKPKVATGLHAHKSQGYLGMWWHSCTSKLVLACFIEMLYHKWQEFIQGPN